MTIELGKEDRQQAIASIERHFEQNLEQKIGNIAAGGLLGFIGRPRGHGRNPPHFHENAVLHRDEPGRVHRH